MNQGGAWQSPLRLHPVRGIKSGDILLNFPLLARDFCTAIDVVPLTPGQTSNGWFAAVSQKGRRAPLITPVADAEFTNR